METWDGWWAGAGGAGQVFLATAEKWVDDLIGLGGPERYERRHALPIISGHAPSGEQGYRPHRHSGCAGQLVTLLCQAATLESVSALETAETAEVVWDGVGGRVRDVADQVIAHAEELMNSQRELIVNE